MRSSDVKETIYRRTMDEMDTVVERAIEYGAHDLRVMGAAMLQLLNETARAHLDDPDYDRGDGGSAFGMCMAVAFYELGKISRMLGTMMQGEWPSNDTVKDIRIYAHMFTHIAEYGDWYVEQDGDNGSATAEQDG